MKRKLLQAVGLSPRWRPESNPDERSPPGSSDGSGGRRHSQQLQRPPSALPHNSADSEQTRPRKQKAAAAPGAVPAPKRACPSPQALPSPAAFGADGAAVRASSAAAPMVVFVLAGDSQVAPCISATGAATPAPPSRAGSAPLLPSPGSLSRQLGLLPPQAAVSMAVPAPQLPAGLSPQQAALGAMQALGIWPGQGQVHMLAPAQQPQPQLWAALAPARQQGLVQAPLADRQEARPSFSFLPAYGGTVSQLALQRSGSAPMQRSCSLQTQLSSCPPSDALAAPASAQWGGPVQPAEPACPQQQQSAFGGFWGGCAPAPVAAPPDWDAFTFKPAAAAMQRTGLSRAGTAPCSLPAVPAEPAPLATPFADAQWAPWASEPAPVPGSPRGLAAQQPAAYSIGPAADPFASADHAATARGVAAERTSSSPTPSPFAAQARVPMPVAEPTRAAAAPAPHCPDLSMTGLAGAGQLPTSIIPRASHSVDLNSLLAAWQSDDAISLTLLG